MMRMMAALPVGMAAAMNRIWEGMLASFAEARWMHSAPFCAQLGISGIGWCEHRKRVAKHADLQRLLMQAMRWYHVPQLRAARFPRMVYRPCGT